MAVPLQVVTVDTAPFKGMRRQLPRIMKQVNLDMGEFYHEKILPRAFEPSAKYRHRHRRRTARYERRKRRLAQTGRVQKGGEADNVFSGRTEQALVAYASLRATRAAVTIRMPGPRYITARVGREITQLSSGERRQLQKFAGADIDKRINDYKNPQTTVIQ